MAICDKISTVGNKLQANLNARGVSCVYGKTSQSKQDLEDMADLITDSNLKGSADYLLSLTASRPYLLEDETTDIIARLVNGLGVPQANKEITIFNNQGGALLLPDNWTVTNGSVSVSGNDITLTATSATNLFIVDPGLFEDYNLTFTLPPGVSLYWSVTNGTPSNKLNASVGGRVISLEKKGNTLCRKIESTQLEAIEEHNGLIAFELSDSGSATVQCSNDASLYRGITNSLGLFTLYDVTVSADTTFTATYSNVSDSIVVEYCAMFDYGVTGNKDSNYTTGSALTISTTTECTSVSSTNSNSSTGRYRSNTAISGNFELIADVKLNQTHSNNAGLYIGVYGNNYTILRIKSKDWFKVKIKREDSVFTVQTSTDGTTWTDATFETNNNTNDSIYPILYVYNNSNSNYGLSYRNLRLKQ